MPWCFPIINRECAGNALIYHKPPIIDTLPCWLPTCTLRYNQCRGFIITKNWMAHKTFNRSFRRTILTLANSGKRLPCIKRTFYQSYQFGSKRNWSDCLASWLYYNISKQNLQFVNTFTSFAVNKFPKIAEDVIDRMLIA